MLSEPKSRTAGSDTDNAVVPQISDEAMASSALQAVTLPGINLAPPAGGTDGEIQTKSIAILAVSHVLDDLNQGALPTMLPYLITAHHLSYEAAAGLVLTTNLFSSMLQPLFGTLSDKPGWKHNLAPIGMSLAGLGVAFTGVMPNYNALLVGAALGGVGLAAYHPDAARTTNLVSGRKKATGMSFFALGGNVGFALGPLAATACVMWMGVRGSLLLLIPAVTMGLILHFHLKKIAPIIAAAKKKASHATTAHQPDQWLAFTFLTLTIICRSIVFFGLNTFLPLYWINQLGQTKAEGSFALTFLLISSAIGTLMGGKLADRVGDWKVNFTALALLPLCIAAFLAANNPALAMIALLPLGMCMSATFSVMVVMGQRYLPRRIGLAAGITLGLAGSIGGLVTPLLGKVADSQGLHAALQLLIGVGVLAFVLAFVVSRVEKRAMVDKLARS